MKVMLLNDTAIVSHVGCLAVSDAHARMLGRRGHEVTRRLFLGDVAKFTGPLCAGVEKVLADEAFVADMAAVDAIIVNGEGTIHHRAGSEYLNVLAAAATIGKATLLVNCVLEAIDGYDQVLQQIDDVTVRDARSLDWLQRHGRQGRLVPDSFLEASFHGDPIIDLSGHVVVTDWHHERDYDTGSASIDFLRYASNYRPFFLPLMCQNVASAWRSVPATLQYARALVTGRHHGIYAAILAKIPFIALSSNTHKVEALLDEAPDLAFCLNPPSIPDALAEAEDRDNAYARFRERLLASLPLTTFDHLGGIPDPTGEAREVGRLAADLAARVNGPGIDLAYRVKRRSVETSFACSK